MPKAKVGMTQYTTLDVLLLVGIAQGVFLAITLPILHNRNVAANKVLALQLLLACAALFARMLLVKADTFLIIQRLAPIETLIFVFGPLGYIYLKRLLQTGQSRFFAAVVPLYSGPDIPRFSAVPQQLLDDRLW